MEDKIEVDALEGTYPNFFVFYTESVRMMAS